MRHRAPAKSRIRTARTLEFIVLAMHNVVGLKYNIAQRPYSPTAPHFNNVIMHYYNAVPDLETTKHFVICSFQALAQHRHNTRLYPERIEERARKARPGGAACAGQHRRRRCLGMGRVAVGAAQEEESSEGEAGVHGEVKRLHTRARACSCIGPCKCSHERPLKSTHPHYDHERGHIETQTQAHIIIHRHRHEHGHGPGYRHRQQGSRFCPYATTAVQTHAAKERRKHARLYARAP